MNTKAHLSQMPSVAVSLRDDDLEAVQGGLSLTGYLTAGGAIIGGAGMAAFGLITAPLTFGGSAAVGVTAGAALIGAGIGALTGTGIEAVRG